MGLTSTSLAVAVGAGVQNTQFTPAANDIGRNIVIVGTFNPSLAGGITAETIYGPYSNAGAMALAFGAGYMLHRLGIGVFLGLAGGGANVYVIPQAEVAGAAATSSTFAITGPATAAGTLNVYVDNIKYAIAVASGDTAATVGTALTNAITADTSCPCSATGTATVSLTSKSKGPWGNSIPVALNIQAGDALPAGITVVTTVLSGGTGVPVIANALNALGTGTNSNNLPNGQWMTDLVHGYLATATAMATTLNDQTTTTAIGTYCGLASAVPPTGCYDHLVGKPFRAFNGDVTNSASLPAALVTYCGTTNTYDRCDQLIAVPASRTHPCEIAAVAAGVVNTRTALIAASSYAEMILTGVEPGIIGNTAQWAADYTNRDNAVKAGISPTVSRGNYVVLQNVVTFYASNTGVSTTSNIYRESVNLVKIANMIWSLISTFRSAKWTGCFIVQDSSRVTDPVAKTKARSTTDVIAELVGLAKAWYAKGWVYNDTFIINALKVPGNVVIRAGGDGFTNQIPAILSGVLNIIDSTINADISLAGVS